MNIQTNLMDVRVGDTVVCKGGGYKYNGILLTVAEVGIRDGIPYISCKGGHLFRRYKKAGWKGAHDSPMGNCTLSEHGQDVERLAFDGLTCSIQDGVKDILQIVEEFNEGNIKLDDLLQLSEAIDAIKKKAINSLNKS